MIVNLLLGVIFSLATVVLLFRFKKRGKSWTLFFAGYCLCVALFMFAAVAAPLPDCSKNKPMFVGEGYIERLPYSPPEGEKLDVAITLDI